MRVIGRIYGIKDKKKNVFVYIGKTERLNDYKPHGTIIRKLFLKYPERYKYSIVEHNVPLRFLNKKEKYYIKKYQTQNFFNFTTGGDGGDTLSMHSRKREIFKKRHAMYPTKKGENNLNYIKLPIETENNIIKIWKSMPIQYLKGLATDTGISKHLCKRTLLKYGYSIPNKYLTQQKLLKAGIITPSRAVQFNTKQEKQIINLYKNSFIGAGTIAKKFGYRSETVIFSILKKYNIKKHSKSAMTRYNNLKRSYNGSCKK